MNGMNDGPPLLHSAYAVEGYPQWHCRSIFHTLIYYVARILQSRRCTLIQYLDARILDGSSI